MKCYLFPGKSDHEKKKSDTCRDTLIKSDPQISENVQSEPSSSPGRGCLHFHSRSKKAMNPFAFPLKLGQIPGTEKERRFVSKVASYYSANNLKVVAVS